MASNVNAKIGIINLSIKCLLEAIRNLQILKMPTRIPMTNAMTNASKAYRRNGSTDVIN